VSKRLVTSSMFMSGERTASFTAATLTFLESTCETGKFAVCAPIGARCKSGDLGLELSTPFCGMAGTAGASGFGRSVHDGVDGG